MVAGSITGKFATARRLGGMAAHSGGHAICVGLGLAIAFATFNETISREALMARFVWLSPPTKPVFIISVVLALLAVLVWLGIVNLGIVRANLFETLLLAYAALLIGNLVRGL